MKKFLDKDFLLSTETAKTLYHKYAKDMPIYDFHCHLSPADIANDRKFKDITEVWLVDGTYGDHYKWRAMRINGVSEECITGERHGYEKFLEWAKTVSATVGNPLYHWTHLELQRYFGITKILNESTAKEIYDACNKELNNGLTARKFIEMSNVKTVCTTDDPIDDLKYHKQIAEDRSFNVRILPSWRPDKVINIELDLYNDWIRKLEFSANVRVSTLEGLKDALRKRLEYFAKNGCRVSDHALDVVLYSDVTENEAEEIFQKQLNSKGLTPDEVAKYKTYILQFLGREYARLGWVMQYHIGALRNNSPRMLKKIGPDTGFDAINDATFAAPLAKILAKLDETDELPKTILYCLNPRDNEVLASLLPCFQSEGIKGKVQFGSAWWFNDQKDGMNRQLEALAQMGLLSCFVGMLTDSRSFLSYPRHEYFRRLLCEKLGQLVENGEFPDQIEYLGKVVQNICYNNANNYFG